MKAYEWNVTDYKGLKKCKKEDLAEAVLEWFVQQRILPITGTIIKIKAEKFVAHLSYTDFSCSNGCLHHFKQRHNICARKICEASTVNGKDVTDWLNTVSTAGFRVT